jgi:hypothetical protein
MMIVLHLCLTEDASAGKPPSLPAVSRRRGERQRAPRNLEASLRAIKPERLNKKGILTPSISSGIWTSKLTLNIDPRV